MRLVYFGKGNHMRSLRLSLRSLVFVGCPMILAAAPAYDSVSTKREITGGNLQNEWFGSNDWKQRILNFRQEDLSGLENGFQR